MTLHQTIADDVPAVFCNSSDFAEAATYYPRSGASRSIIVVIERNEIALLQGDDVTVAPQWIVHVENNATRGISSTELNKGGDQIGFPPRDGEAAARKTITELLTQDHGMLVVECR